MTGFYLKDRNVIFVLLILLFGFYLRVDNLGFGLPLIFNRDEPRIVDNAIRMVESGDWNPRFFVYPPFMIYLTAFAYKALLFFEHIGIVHVDTPLIYLTSRFLSAFFGTLTIFVVYLLGKESADEKTGMVAALFLAVAPLHVEHSHYAVIHVPVTFFITLCLYFCVLAIRRGGVRYYVGASVSAGLAASTSYVGGLLLIPIVITFFLERLFSIKFDGSKNLKHLSLIFIVLVLPIASYLFLAPYTLLDYDGFFEDFNRQFDFATSDAGALISDETPGLFFYLGIPLSEGLGIKLELLSILGLLYALLHFRREYLVLLYWAVPYYLSISQLSLKYDRYILPIVPPLLLFASMLLLEIVNTFSRFFKKYSSKSTTTIFALILLLSILLYPWSSLQTTFYKTTWINNFLFGETDTRTLAFEWFEENVPSDAVVVRGDLTPDLEFSEKNYTVLSYRGADEMSLLSMGYGWLLDQNVHYAVFSDLPYVKYGRFLGVRDVLDKYFLSLNMNAELIKMFAPSGLEYESVYVTLLPGENTIMFHSLDGCTVPIHVIDSTDVRCLSFEFRNISVIALNYSNLLVHSRNIPTTPHNFTLNYSGWYPEEERDGEPWRWMNQNAEIIVNNPYNSSINAKIGFRSRSFHQERILEVFAGDEKPESFIVDTGHMYYHFPLVNLSLGDNVLRFSSVGCDIPSEVDPLSGDSRCLSIYLENFTVLSVEYFANLSPHYENYWYIEDDGSIRWMKQNATISIYNPLNVSIQAKVGLELSSFHRNRTIEIFSENMLIGKYDIPQQESHPGPTIWIYKIVSDTDSL
ncbi:MAG: glycosyltransferase family 39 protein [Candidatus Altiarchaeota archaeon]